MYNVLHALEPLICPASAIASTIAFWASLQVFRMQRIVTKRHTEQSWLFISAGIGLWAISHIANTLMDYFIGRPAIALTLIDLIVYAGYILIIVGLVVSLYPIFNYLRETGRDKPIKAVLVITVVSGTALIYYIASQIPYLVGGGSKMLILTETVYVILDLIVLMLTLKAVILFLGGTLAKKFALIFLGFMLVTIADLLVALTGDYVFLNGIVRLIGYAVLAGGIYSYGESPPIV